MTATAFDVHDAALKRATRLVRRLALAVRIAATAAVVVVVADWRAVKDGGQLGPDGETVIGRATGARV